MKSNRVLKGKIWGPIEELEIIKHILADNFECIISQTKKSDQGGGHFFFSVLSTITNPTTGFDSNSKENQIGRHSSKANGAINTLAGERECPPSPWKR